MIKRTTLRAATASGLSPWGSEELEPMPLEPVAGQVESESASCLAFTRSARHEKHSV